jgi:outer membrane scaffolding protein for murein synthesis (MipA/OmpV family)
MANVGWADEDYTKSYFGVTASEAAASGMRPFQASAGVRDVGFTLSSRFPIWRQLSLVGAANYERLLGDAADSPLTDDRGDANQFSANLGLIYRF